MQPGELKLKVSHVASCLRQTPAAQSTCIAGQVLAGCPCWMLPLQASVHVLSLQSGCQPSIMYAAEGLQKSQLCS